MYICPLSDYSSYRSAPVDPSQQHCIRDVFLLRYICFKHVCNILDDSDNYIEIKEFEE